MSPLDLKTKKRVSATTLALMTYFLALALNNVFASERFSETLNPNWTISETEDCLRRNQEYLALYKEQLAFAEKWGPKVGSEPPQLLEIESVEELNLRCRNAQRIPNRNPIFFKAINWSLSRPNSIEECFERNRTFLDQQKQRLLLQEKQADVTIRHNDLPSLDRLDWSCEPTPYHVTNSRDQIPDETDYSGAPTTMSSDFHNWPREEQISQEELIRFEERIEETKRCLVEVCPPHQFKGPEAPAVPSGEVYPAIEKN